MSHPFDDLPDTTRPAGNLIAVIRAALPDLRRSDAKVAELVLADPASLLRLSVAEAAAQAGVSQPTVMRFCAAIGLSGFQEFKLRLAQSLALGQPATHSVISEQDDVADVAEKIFDYTLTSLDWARRHLDRAALADAVRQLAIARSILFFGFGASGLVAEDAQQKFPLFGVPCRAYSDAHQQIMAASIAQPGDVVVVISHTGRTRDIVEAAKIVRSSGAYLIGIVGASGPVSDLCDTVLLVETLDNTSIYTPTTSRIAALVVIDILSTSVALQRDPAHIDRLRTMKQRLNRFRASAPDDFSQE